MYRDIGTYVPTHLVHPAVAGCLLASQWLARRRRHIHIQIDTEI